MIEEPSTEANARPPEAYHPAIAEILRYFMYGQRDWPPPSFGVFAETSKLAHSMADKLDGPELTAGLRKLLEARDCFMRAALSRRRDVESAAQSGTETAES